MEIMCYKIPMEISLESYLYHLVWRVTSRAVRNGDCLEYRGGDLKHKYGLVSVTIAGKRKSIPAHRAVWIGTHKCFDLPRNVYICHKCDNPCCVNIDHLFAGTPKDNTRDMLAKDRNAKTRKKHTRQYKLDNATVLAIRNEPPYLSGKHIANKYNISQGYVSKLRSGTAKTLVV